jgi:hypothetical protein
MGNNETNSDDQLKNIVTKWQNAYFISQALLEDYSEQLAMLTKEDKESIKKRVMDKANSIHSESK